MDERALRVAAQPSGVMRAGVVVIGDAGRSPRMARHAAALASHGWEVDFIALRGEHRAPDLPGVHLVEIDDPTSFRMTRIALRLLRILAAKRHDVVLLQNPPAFPTIPVAIAARCRFIVDWHNLTVSMLALRVRSRALLALVRWCEVFLARAANGHFAVTPQLAEHLRRRGIGGVVVLRDAPRQLAPDGRRRAAAFPAGLSWLNTAPRTGPLLVMPTSWTADEDLDMLIDAMTGTEGVTLVVTGDGRRRRDYETRLSRLPVAVATGWLEEDEYEQLLRSADAGLSLHRSASGVDFPMKIVDFLGAGLPVIAFDYGEAVREPLEGSGAAFFTTAAELASIIRQRSFRAPAGPRSLWESLWSERAEPLLRSVARA